MSGSWRPRGRRGTRASRRHGGSRDWGTCPHRRSRLGLRRSGRSWHGWQGGVHPGRCGGHWRLSAHVRQSRDSLGRWTSSGPRQRNRRWGRSHRRPRWSRHSRRHRRYRRPSRSSRHRHGRRCGRGHRALRRGRCRRVLHGRHLSGCQPRGWDWRGHRLRRHGSNGRGSWRRSRRGMCRNLRRPRNCSGNSTLCCSRRRMLWSSCRRCHRHLWPRGTWRSLLCRCAWRLLCARYRRMSHAGLHARRARRHRCRLRPCGRRLRTGWRGRRVRSSGCGLGSRLCQYGMCRGMCRLSPRLHWCMVRPRRRLLRTSRSSWSHRPCSRWRLDRRNLSRRTGSRRNRRRCGLGLAWNGRKSRRPWRRGGRLLWRGRRGGALRWNTRSRGLGSQVHSRLRHRSRTRCMRWLRRSRGWSSRQTRRPLRLRCQRGRSPRCGMSPRRRMSRCRGMGTCRRMSPRRWSWTSTRRRMSRCRGMRTRCRMSPGCGMPTRHWTRRRRWRHSGRWMCSARWNRRHRRTRSRRAARRALRLRHRRSHRRARRSHRPRVHGVRRGSVRRRGWRGPRRTGRLRRPRVSHRRPGLRRQAGTRGARLRSRTLWRHRSRCRRPRLSRGRRPRRSHRQRRRGSRLSLVVIVCAQELAQRELPKRRPLERHHGRRSRGGPSPGLVLALLRFITQELAGSEPAEHALLLWTPLRSRGPCTCRRSRCSSGRRCGSSSRKPCASSGLGRLRVQLDVPLRADDPVALLQVEVEPQLWDNARDDAQARGERQLVHRRHVGGARHRELQLASVRRKREHEVLLGQLRRDRAERGRRHGLELRDRRLRIARLLREHCPQRLDVQVLQLDQVGPQPGAIDHLGLEGLLELALVDEALADQDRAELFRHEGLDSRRLP
jgi:hypothetical protein